MIEWNKVLYIDCMDPEKGLPSLPDKSIDMAITDPPYNIKCHMHNMVNSKEKEGKIDIPSFLDGLPENHYFSFDYPCDMNPKYQDRFLDKTWYNANKYCNHPNYIVTAQYQFNNYWCFTHWFDKYNQLPIKSGIMGLGNLCRIMHLTEFMKHALGYAFKHCNHPRIHIYGLALRIIPYAFKLAKRFNIELSVDSTKWTRPVTNELKEQCRAVSCKAENRQLYFDTYIEELKKRGVTIS